jgi:hypothetical protein
MHPIQDLFLEGFSYVLQIDMHFICTLMWTKFYSCKKWVLQRFRERLNKRTCKVLSENTSPSEVSYSASICCSIDPKAF